MSKTFWVLRRWWDERELTTQFGLVSCVLTIATMAIIGSWVSDQIQRRVLQEIAISRTMYLDDFISPLSQDLARSPELAPKARNAFSHLLEETPFGRHVVSVKIWTPDGRVAFSSDPDNIGKRFPVEGRLKDAYEGTVSVEIIDPHDNEHRYEQQFGRPLFELFAPVFETGTGRVIGVAELYEIADEAMKDIRRAGVLSWLIVGAIAIGKIAILSSIVWHGGRTIAWQRQALVTRIGELSRLLNVNRHLRERLRLAHVKAATENEHYLRRVGADLHDGPAQLISLALLLHDRTAEGCPHDSCTWSTQNLPNLERIRAALGNALTEIRTLSAGLAPPSLEGVSPTEAIMSAIRAHERLTGTSVDCKMTDMPGQVSTYLNVCLYRFVQECLSNAFKHAQAKGQRVRAARDGDALVVEVKDDGPGFSPHAGIPETCLGLAGLRARIEALGGQFKAASMPNGGTRVFVRFNLGEDPSA